MSKNTAPERSVRQIPKRGLEVDMQVFEEVRLKNGMKSLWNDVDNRDNLLFSKEAPISRFLARFVELRPDEKVAIFEFKEDGKEFASKSEPINPIRGVPQHLKDQLERSFREIEVKADDPKATDEAKEFIRSLRFEDPKTSPDMYRLYKDGGIERLLVVWGCHRRGSMPLLPLEAIQRLPSYNKPKLSILKGLLGAAALLLLLICLLPLWSYWNSNKWGFGPFLASNQIDEKELERQRLEQEQRQKQLEQQKKDLENREAAVAANEKELNDQKAKLEEEANGLKKKESALLVDLQNRETAVAASEKDLNDRKAKLEEEADAVKKKEDELRKQQDVLATTRSEIKDMEAKIAASGNQEDIDAELERLDKLRKKFEADEAEIKKDKELLASRQAEMLEKREREEAAMRADKLLLETQKREVDAQKNEMISLKNQLQKQKQEMDKLQKDLANAKEEPVLPPPYLSLPSRVWNYDDMVQVNTTVSGRLAIFTKDMTAITDTPLPKGSPKYRITPGYKIVQFTAGGANVKKPETAHIVVYDKPTLAGRNATFPLEGKLNELGLRLDWGDGTPAIALNSQNGAQHKYSQKGKYTLQVIPPASLEWARWSYELDVP